MVLQDVRGKVEDDKEHGSLVGKGGGAVLGDGVGGNLVVDVVGAQTPNDHVDELRWDRHPLEVLFGVVWRAALAPCHFRGPQQLAHFVDVLVLLVLALYSDKQSKCERDKRELLLFFCRHNHFYLVAVVGDEHAFANETVDAQVDAEKHYAVQVKCLGLSKRKDETKVE